MWQYIPGQFCGGGVVAVKIEVLKMIRSFGSFKILTT